MPWPSKEEKVKQRHPGLEPGASALGVPRATIAPEPRSLQVSLKIGYILHQVSLLSLKAVLISLMITNIWDMESY